MRGPKKVARHDYLIVLETKVYDDVDPRSTLELLDSKEALSQEPVFNTKCFVLQYSE